MSTDRFEHHYVDVNAIRLHYASHGQGRLIMFLHGFPEFWAAWEAQLSDFGRDHLAVAPDLRGYNLSSKPADPKQYHVKILVEDIRALLDHLGHERMVLVAHDWGGGVAWAFANRYPERLDKLVIINSPHPAVFARELLNSDQQQKASAYMNMFRQPDAEAKLSKDNFSYLITALSKWGSKWRMSEALRQRYIEAWSQPGALTGGLNYYRISPVHPAVSKEEEQVLRQIAALPRQTFEVKVPTLVLWGELDEALLPGNLDGLEEFVNDLTVRRMADGTHWVIHEQPELINARIRAFIDSK
ncbi:MAG: alpha/beta hydrolase [Desulfobacteraceae bacterium]|nr:alpha/beta hydrolase [Desulfobacteraceae bacterium]